VETSSLDTRNPVIAIDDTDRLYVAFENRTGGEEEWRFNISDSYGTVWFTFLLGVTGFDPSQVRNPAIAAEGSGESLAIVFGMEYENDIRLFYHPHGPTSWWGMNIGGYTDALDTHPSVAVSTDNFILVFESEMASDNRDLLIFSRDLLNTPIDTYNYLSNTSYDERYPSVDAEGDTVVAVGWLVYGMEGLLVSAGSDDSGLTFPNTGYPGYRAGYPAIDVTSAGARVAYTYENGISCVESTDSGTTWTGLGNITDGDQVIVPEDDVLALWYGVTDPLVVWEESRETTAIDIYSEFLSEDLPTPTPSITPTPTITPTQGDTPTPIPPIPATGPVGMGLILMTLSALLAVTGKRRNPKG